MNNFNSIVTTKCVTHDANVRMMLKDSSLESILLYKKFNRNNTIGIRICHVFNDRTCAGHACFNIEWFCGIKELVNAKGGIYQPICVTMASIPFEDILLCKRDDILTQILFNIEDVTALFAPA